MKNKKIISFLNSLVFLPVLIMSAGSPILPMSQVVANVVGTPLAQVQPKQDLEAQKLAALKVKADAIDGYFKQYDMPLFGTGIKMVQEAEKNNIDWRLLPAIAVRESTGGQHACITAPYNPFGWASCKVGFDSIDKAIEVVAKNLGGNNPKTERHYSGKTTKEILKKYNPPSIVLRYAEQVIDIMNTIGEPDVATVPLVAIS